MNQLHARPDPDALLKVAQREGRGRLKVYLGASPGVGKTYEMLSDAGALQRGGVDVVVGVVETHGRAETAALVEGLEVITRRQIAYRGRTIEEMDLDAILGRRPRLVLVDELAHTNATESRHPKRWQDVEELLDAGIDVHTTVNIQHIESLNDVVASFTRVRVRETVPDHVLENAELEVVDLPPDELIQRLKDGKVYVPDEAGRALSHFFSRSNLSALRELALRKAAQAVDTQMLDDLRAEAAIGPWAASERIVVAISELAGSENLVRSAKRLADTQRATWTALTVETPRSATLSDGERQRLASTIRLASELGANTASLPAASAVEGIKAFAQANRITQIVVGKSVRSRWFELRHGSVVDQLVRETPEIAVHVLPMPQAETRPLRARATSAPDWRHWPRYLGALAMVATVTALGRFIHLAGNVTDVALLFLIPVMFAAMRWGLRAGLFSAVGSALSYNFFFLPPTMAFTIADPANILTLFIFLGVAAVTSHLAGGLQRNITIAQRSAHANAVLANFARQLGTLDGGPAIAAALAREIAALFAADSVVMRREQGELVSLSPEMPASALGAVEMAAADWAESKGQPAGQGSQTLTASDWMFYPLRAGESHLGVIGVGARDGGTAIRSDQLPLFLGLIDQAALALERERLADEMRQLDRLRDRDALRSTLLSSVSHDLRTPLTALRAAVAELRVAPSPHLIETIDNESQRLEGFFDNLLDMTRIESGAVEVHSEPVDLTDAVAHAVHATRRQLGSHTVHLNVPVNLPLVTVDPRLFHHCLINLLANAAKYSPQGSTITISGERSRGELVLSVIDEGPGLPADEVERVFDTFHQLGGTDRNGGSGLGLAIVKGFAEAMGLHVRAANRADRPGAVFSLCFAEDHLVTIGEA